MHCKLYILDCKDLDSKLINKLSLVEIEKINKIENKEDKLLSLGAHLLIKIFTSKEDVKFKDNNRPYKDTAPFFSISHSNPYSLILLAENTVGVDIENINRINNVIKKHLFSIKEREYIKNEEDFIKLWTIKEASYKALDLNNYFNFKEEIRIINNKCKYLKNELFYKSFHFENFYISIASKVDFDFDSTFISKENLDNLLVNIT